jgi:hypothetical protein
MRKKNKLDLFHEFEFVHMDLELYMARFDLVF